MKTIKRIWLFLLVMFVAPLCLIVVAGWRAESLNGYIWSVLISIATSLIAAGIVYWFIDKRLTDLLKTDDEITVVLQSPNGTELKCPPMSREDFCRSEVLGYIGMLGGPDRFKIASMKSPEFGENIRRVKSAKGNCDLVVICTDDEIEMFQSKDQHDK